MWRWHVVKSIKRRRRLFGIVLAVVTLGLATTHAGGLLADESPAAPSAGSDETSTALVADEAEVSSAPPVTLESLNELLTTKSVALDTVWVLVTAFLVMWMQAGFALVETGLTRAKNAVNICMKNLLDFCFGSLAFWAVGFALMFGAGSKFVGQTGFFLRTSNPDTDFASIAWTTVPLEAKFFFQLVFAATTATIVSGAMAERTKFVSYMVYSFIVSLLIYPISGHWIWGGGWLAELGFWDFAGSTVVHSLGGWLSLVGAFVLGARSGKYDPATGQPRALPGHNLVLVTLGVFILWLGWFGFNPGSTMAAVSADIAHVTVTTNSAAATGAILALMTAKVLFKKWEATMALNGALAGLVAITCPCYWVSVPSSIIIGAVAGVLVVLSVIFIDKVLKVDDPVGAISVHGVCGAWGTLSLGLFSNGTGDASPLPGLFTGGDATQLIHQATGVVAVLAWGLATGLVLFQAIRLTIGLRVSPEEEVLGLDFGEHGNEAYHGFVMTESPR
jgi:Amt family ammonium transporter